MAIPSALACSRPPEYRRHRPESSLLYQLIREYWPEFQVDLASQGRYLPAYVTKEFDEYLKCGGLEHGFLRVRCAGVAAKANERTKLERLCRYITRPAISTKRLSMTRNGQVRRSALNRY